MDIVINGVPVQFDRYLARGNFGSVYIGYFGMKKVAVKVSKSSLDREYQCLKLISTPLYYKENVLVTDYYGDFTLKKWIDTVKVIPFSQKEVVMTQLLKKVQELHDKNVAHHDIKSENVVVNQLEVFLIDFGFSSCKQDDYRKMGKGSIQYVPPECFTNKMCLKSDVWSLGVLFYELVTNGEFPFFGKDESMMKNEIVKKNPTPFAKRHEFTPKWEKIIISMLNKDVEKRPSCQEILNSL
jgi:serine/threonine protein kinase